MLIRPWNKGTFIIGKAQTKQTNQRESASRPERQCQGFSGTVNTWSPLVQMGSLRPVPFPRLHVGRTALETSCSVHCPQRFPPCAGRLGALASPSHTKLVYILAATLGVHPPRFPGMVPWLGCWVRGGAGLPLGTWQRCERASARSNRPDPPLA